MQDATNAQVAARVETAVAEGCRTSAEISTAVGVPWTDDRMYVAMEALQQVGRIRLADGGYMLGGGR